MFFYRCFGRHPEITKEQLNCSLSLKLHKVIFQIMNKFIQYQLKRVWFCAREVQLGKSWGVNHGVGGLSTGCTNLTQNYLVWSV